MKLQDTISNLGQIIIALDTLRPEGYTQCKTYTNIFEALKTIEMQLNELETHISNGTDGDNNGN